MKKILFTLILLSLFGCKSETPIPPIEEPKVSWANATIFLDTGTGYQNDGTASFTGSLNAIKSDGSYHKDIYKTDIDGSKIGYLCSSITNQNNKIYLLATQNVEDRNKSSIVILNSEDMTFDKRIDFQISKDGVSLIPNSLVVVSAQKAYLIFSSQIVPVNLEKGELGEKIDIQGDYYPSHPSRAPFYLIGNKVCGIMSNYSDEVNLISVDTNSDVATVTNLGYELDFVDVNVLKGSNNELIVLTNSFFDEENSFLYRISITDAKQVGETMQLKYPKSYSAVISNTEPIVYYSGKTATNNEKTIFKYNYQTDETETFTKVETENGDFALYRINLMMNPITEELNISVFDSYDDRFIRIYDTKNVTLPATKKAEHKTVDANNISEMIINKIL